MILGSMLASNVYHRRLLSLVVFLTFFVSVVVAFYYRIPPAVDAGAYNHIGWNLARGFGYVEFEQLADRPAEDDAIIRVGPGYEFFLAGIYAVFGHSLPAVWFIQSVLRAITAVVVYFLSLKFFSTDQRAKEISLVAAALFGLMPDLVVANGMLLAETLFLFFLGLSVVLSLKALERQGVWPSLSAGLLWAFAALTRPTALAGLLVLFGVFVFRKKIGLALVLMIFPLIVVGGWSLRNSLLYGQPLFTTTAGSFSLWVGNNPEATGGYDKSSEILLARQKNHSVDLSKIAMERFSSFVKEHPADFFVLQLKKTVTYFSLLRPTGFWFYLNGRPWHQLATLIFSGAGTALLFVLGSVGFYAYFIGKESHRFFLLAMTIIQPLVVIPTYVETRYRYPLFLFLAPLAAYAWVQRPWRRPLFFIVLALFLSISAYDALANFDKITMRILSIIEI